MKQIDEIGFKGEIQIVEWIVENENIKINSLPNFLSTVW